MKMEALLFITFVVLITPAINAPIAGISSGDKEKIQPDELHKILPQVTVIDIRNFDDYALSHIKGAISIPFSCKTCFINEIRDYKNNEIVLYCQNGMKSREAAMLLIRNGFRHIHYLEGGINEWIENGYETESTEKGLGCIPLKNEQPDEIGETGSYPPYWNWRDATYNGRHGDWTTIAKNQGGCGSCWDFAAMGALEAIINIREGSPDLDVDLSEQYLLSCPPDSGGCSGWNAYYAYKYMYENGGALPEECFPYQADDSVPCSYKCEDWESKLIPISDYGWYSHPNRDFIKSLIYSHGPVVATMEVYEDFLWYERGIYVHHSGGFVGWHQVVMVGYDDRNHCWICKNSWGRSWGENGFFKIAYGECEIESEIVYVDYDANSCDWSPVANAGGGYYGNAGEEIQFYGSKSYDVDGDIVNYTWNFGDGNISYEINPKHAYMHRGLYRVTLTVTDAKGNKDTNETAAFIEVWKNGDAWHYEITASGNVDYFISFSFKTIMKDFAVKVKNEGEDCYVISFGGRARGNVIIPLYPYIPLRLNAIIFLFPAKIDGNAYVHKFGYGVESMNIEVRATAWLMVFPIPLIFPIPFNIRLSLSFDPPYYLMPLVPEVGKIWNSEANASLRVTLSTFFGIISKSFDVQNLPSFLTFMYMECLSKEIVNVPAGEFEVYKILVLEAMEFYYSMDAGNVVKAQLSEDFENVNFVAELKSFERA